MTTSDRLVLIGITLLIIAVGIHLGRLEDKIDLMTGLLEVDMMEYCHDMNYVDMEVTIHEDKGVK